MQINIKIGKIENKIKYIYNINIMSNLEEKINVIKHEINIRTVIPEHLRTTRQAIKIDNLSHELKLLLKEYNNEPSARSEEKK